MYNCIFSGHCTEDYACNMSCPVIAETSYLLERNGIGMNNSVFKMTDAQLTKYRNILNEASGKISSVIVSSGDFTNQAADALTYCAICDNWRGSQLHCTVYNLKFAQYIESMKSSWSYSDDSSDTMEQTKIWISHAKVLIISNLDFINFKDFQCQVLLSLLQSRASVDQTTIIVSPSVNSLVGEGQFFAKMTSIISKQKVGETL